MFLGPRGIRSPWRVLLALAFYKIFAYTIGAALIANGIVYRWLEAERLASLSPGLLLFGESIRTLAGLLAGICMAKIEGRSFSEYGLKWNKVSAKQFLFGIPLGLAMLALLMSTMYALRAVSFSVDSLNASEVLKHGVLYGAGYLLVGLFEEGAFRGYLQATLATDFGFWPTAFVLSITFGAVHLGNRGESIFGILMASCFGLLAAFSVRRTGNIWLAIGMHASWDWGQSFLYGTPNSGIVARGHLLLSWFHGSQWLTGGSVGPEGSVLVFPVLLFWVLTIHSIFPAKARNA